MSPRRVKTLLSYSEKHEREDLRAYNNTPKTALSICPIDGCMPLLWSWVGLDKLC